MSRHRRKAYKNVLYHLADPGVLHTAPSSELRFARQAKFEQRRCHLQVTTTVSWRAGGARREAWRASPHNYRPVRAAGLLQAITDVGSHLLLCPGVNDCRDQIGKVSQAVEFAQVVANLQACTCATAV